MVEMSPHGDQISSPQSLAFGSSSTIARHRGLHRNFLGSAPFRTNVPNAAYLKTIS